MPNRPPTSRCALTLLAPALLLAGCSASSGAATAQDLGPEATRDYSLNGFDRVELKSSDDVVVHIGPAFAVRAQGRQSVLDRLDLTVSGGTLKVSRRAESMAWNGPNTGATITVTMPALAAASVTGAGDMTVDAAGGRAFVGSTTGSGNLDIAQLEAPIATLSIAGAGDLRARGKIGRGDYRVTGSGNLDARGLEAETIRGSVAGSGDIDARATGSAELSIVGSGDVTVGGGARCTVSKVGSGEAKCG